MNGELLILSSIGVALAVIGYGLSRLLVRRGQSLDERLQGSAARKDAVQRDGPGTFVTLLDRVGRTAGKPFQPTKREDQSALRRQLGYAGFYSTSAAHLVAGGKAIALASGLFLGYASGLALNKMLLCMWMGGMIGYFIPVFWLSAKVKSRQKAIEHGLPDALDLMVVCVEAGLTLDAAMQRVGQEIHLAHPALSRELSVTHMEAQMGIPRPDALRNLARRTGSRAVQSLTAMLIQAERLGTGIAQALRIHAESLRIKRQYAAEETAAKAAVKMTIPLVFFIFPAMLVVIGGPGIIRLRSSGLMGSHKTATR